MSLSFVENLTVRRWFDQILPVLIQRRAGTASQKCFAIDGSRFALAVANASSFLAQASVEKLSFRLIDVRDESGLLSRLVIANRDLAEVQSYVEDEVRLEDLVRDETEGRLVAFLRKAVVTVSLSEQATLWRALLLVHVADWQRRKLGSAGSEALLFLERRAWGASVKRFSSGRNISVVELPAALTFSELRRRFGTPRPVAFLRWLRNGVYKLRHRAVQPVAKTPLAGKLGVEYAGQLNLKYPERHSDFFFWQRSEFPARNILVMNALPQDPFDEAKAASLAEYEIASVALHPGATRCDSVPFFIHRPHLPNYARHETRSLRSPGRIEARWVRNQVNRYFIERDYWADLFRSYNVKIFLTWYRFDNRHYAIADALESLGGVTAIYQRACQPDPTAEICVNAEVMFGYSPKDADVERRAGSIIQYHVAVGYFGDHRFALLREPALRMREELQRNGATRILAFFDENSGPDERWHTGARFQAENYEFLLEKVLAEPWLGLVIKPKVPNTLRARLGPAVAGLLDRAIATGRCHLYQEGTLHGSHPPALAALSADIALHGHLCGATAGLEAALAGVPTLMLDREGWHVSPFYQLGVGRVVFHDWPSLWSRLTEHWTTAQGVPGFGDWSSMLETLDPFRDGRAAERMGTYLKWLIEGLNSGQDRQLVMANAAERYGSIWGFDKITELSKTPGSPVLLPS